MTTPKILSGRDLAGFVKERQANYVKTLNAEGIFPTLLILRDSNNPVIEKYVNLKQRYGVDIGVEVRDCLAESEASLEQAILSANQNPEISGLIVQLPLKSKEKTPALLAKIAPQKDLDGLSGSANFDSATATAINWLLSSYSIPLEGQKIAIIGRGLLVGAPLMKMFKNSGLNPVLFHRGSDLSKLKEFDVIITATGVPGLIKSEMLKSGATVVDAGTASEDGVLKGDLDDSVRETRSDLFALTPKLGGVGPLTVSVLFENLLAAAAKQKTPKNS